MPTAGLPAGAAGLTVVLGAVGVVVGSYLLFAVGLTALE